MALLKPKVLLLVHTCTQTHTRVHTNLSSISTTPNPASNTNPIHPHHFPTPSQEMCRIFSSQGLCSHPIAKWRSCYERSSLDRMCFERYGYIGEPCQDTTHGYAVVPDGQHLDFCCSPECCAANLADRDQVIADVVAQFAVANTERARLSFSQSKSHLEGFRASAAEQHLRCNGRRVAWQQTLVGE